MSESSIKIVRPIGTIREYNKISIDVNLIEIRHGEYRYDIRKFESGKHMSRGISLDEEAARNLYMILQKEFDSKNDKVTSAGAHEKSGLYDILAAVRTVVAEYEGVRAYMVFTNETLQEMCDRLPRDMDDLRKIKGVGPSKSSRYGQEFLTAINNYLKRN